MISHSTSKSKSVKAFTAESFNHIPKQILTSNFNNGETMTTTIPDEILIPAINRTMTAFKGCTDNWGEEAAAHCRKLCGDAFRHIETDLIRARATNLRKAGKLESAGGPKRKKLEPPTGDYADYLETAHWKAFRLSILEFWNWSCCLCEASNRLEVHHRNYLRLGSERQNDCVCLCHSCHSKVHGQMADGNEILNSSSAGSLF